jgi:hypothetical protein
MTIEQGLLTDREYIILLEAKIRMLERRFSKAPLEQPRIDPDKADAARRAMERLGWIPRYCIRRQEGVDQCD